MTPCLHALISFLLLFCAFTFLNTVTGANDPIGKIKTTKPIELADVHAALATDLERVLLELKDRELQKLILQTLQGSKLDASSALFDVKAVYYQYLKHSDVSIFIQLFVSSMFPDSFYEKLDFANVQLVLEMLDNHIDLLPTAMTLPSIGRQVKICPPVPNIMAYSLRAKSKTERVTFKNPELLQERFLGLSINFTNKVWLSSTLNSPRPETLSIAPLRLFYFSGKWLWNSLVQADLSAFTTHFKMLSNSNTIRDVLRGIYQTFNDTPLLKDASKPTLGTISTTDLDNWIKGSHKSLQPIILLFVQCILDRFHVNGPEKSCLVIPLSKFIQYQCTPENDEKNLFLLYTCLLEYCDIATINCNMFDKLSPNEQDEFMYQVHAQFDAFEASKIPSFPMPCQYWSAVITYSHLPITMLKRIDRKVFSYCMLNHTIHYYDLRRLTDDSQRFRDNKVIFGSMKNEFDDNAEPIFNILYLYNPDNIWEYDSSKSSASRNRNIIKGLYETYHNVKADYSTVESECVPLMASFFSEFLPTVDYSTFKQTLSDGSDRALEIFVKGGTAIQDAIYRNVVLDDITRVCEQAQKSHSVSTFYEFACRRKSDYCDEHSGLRLDSITDKDMDHIRDMLVNPNDKLVMHDCLLNIWRRANTYKNPTNATRISTFSNVDGKNGCSNLLAGSCVIYISILIALFA